MYLTVYVVTNILNTKNTVADREGYIMLIVEISVNTKLIGRETAIRVEGTTDALSKNKYVLSDGTVIEHVYGDGAVVLAEKMMSHLKKMGRI